jgi:phosphoribosylamine---glycine ligase
VEFNARLGDPETQPIMMRLRSDLVDVLEAAIEGKLANIELEWDRRTALAVVVAAHNYPDTPRKGDEIKLPADTEHVTIFHAGTKLVDGKLSSDGGRVLAVTALGESAKSAQQRAYELVEKIQLDGAQFRRDIGYRAISRK